MRVVLGFLGRPCVGGRLWRVAAALALAAGVLPCPPATAEAPAGATGAWAGTWWMGKYEEPIELDVSPAGGEVTGRVSVWNYPGTGASEGGRPVRASVTGTVDGRRVRLSWAMPQHGRFSVELTLLTPDQRFGSGGPGSTAAGFELRRTR